METEIIVSLIGISGISIAALFSGFGYYLKTRAERSINKRVVLFHLLEFRRQFQISFKDPKDLSDQYFEFCKSYFFKKGIDSESHVSNEVRHTVDSLLIDLMAAKMPKIDDKFLESYEESLKKLCESDPVLAFKLRGAERKNEILTAKKKHILNFNEIDKSDVVDPIKKIVHQELKTAGEQHNIVLLKDLEGDILSTAWSCSFYTWIKCLIITNKKISSANFDESELEKAFDNLLKKVTDGAATLSDHSLGK
jgi:hypothetical protein